jgi:hypothetical protein
VKSGYLCTKNPVIEKQKVNTCQTLLIFYLRGCTNLYFRFSQCLNHETIILRQEKNTTTFPRRRKFPESIIPTNGHHVICSINLEQFPQVPTMNLHKDICINNIFFPSNGYQHHREGGGFKIPQACVKRHYYLPAIIFARQGFSNFVLLSKE